MIEYNTLKDMALQLGKSCSELENDLKCFITDDMYKTFKGKYVRFEYQAYARDVEYTRLGVCENTRLLDTVHTTGTMVVYAQLSDEPFSGSKYGTSFQVDTRNGCEFGRKEFHYDPEYCALGWFFFVPNGTYYEQFTDVEGDVKWTAVNHSDAILSVPVLRDIDKYVLWDTEYLRYISQGSYKYIRIPETEVKFKILSKEEFEKETNQCRTDKELSDYAYKVARLKELEKKIAEYDNNNK